MAPEGIQHPLGTFASSEASPNPALKNLSLDQLQELVEWPSKMAEAVAQEPEPAQMPEPDEPTPSDPTPVPETPPEVAQEAAPVKPVEPSQEDIDRELLASRIEAAEAHAKKLEAKLVGREAGENGYIQQLKERIRRLESGVDPEPVQYQEPSESAPVQDTKDGLKAWAIQQATKEAFSSFMASHVDSSELEQEMTKYLQDSGFDGSRLTQLGDPIAAAREVTRMLDESYWSVKESRVRSRVAELQTRKADQVRGLEEAKRRATSSAAGSPTPPLAPRKTTSELSLSELEARMKALSRR